MVKKIGIKNKSAIAVLIWCVIIVIHIVDL